MPEVSGDFETRSTVDLRKCGVYKYAESPSTDVWCFAFGEDDDSDDLWTPLDYLLNTPVHHKLMRLAADPAVIWRAWNAQFERTIWRLIMVPRYGFPDIPLERWVCTAAEAAALGLPRALENTARVLNIAEQKDMAGHGLMMRMARPRNSADIKKDPTIQPTWWDDDERKQRLFVYCRQDVRVERGVARQIKRLPPSEIEIYRLDQRINDRGIRLDRSLAASMKVLADEATARANLELRRLTGAKAVKISNTQSIRGFLNELNFTDEAISSVDKTAIQRLLATDLPEAARQVLNLRVEAGKSSVSKLVAMFNAVCADDRMRGLLLYHGAGTGRWAGKLVQPQNFYARSPILPEAFKPLAWRDPVLARSFDLIDASFPVLEVLAMLLRPCMVPAPGKRFIGGDFNAIEARVLAWLAGCNRILQEYRDGVDGYKVMGAEIYKVPLADVTKPMRQMGKNARLGLGFGMGDEKFVADTYKKSGQIIELPFATRVVRLFRDGYEEIPDLWDALEEAAINAVRTPGATFYAADGRLIFVFKDDFLRIILPSRKRALAYYKPRVADRLTPWGKWKPTVEFQGEIGPSRRWGWQSTYGGLWAENVTQAAARDLMAEAMIRADANGYPVVLTVHDEIVSEVDEGFGSAAEFEEIMCASEGWAAGCPVKAEVDEMECYQK